MLVLKYNQFENTIQSLVVRGSTSSQTSFKWVKLEYGWSFKSYQAEQWIIHALFEYNELQKCNSFMQQAALELFTAFNSSTLNSEHHQHAVENLQMLSRTRTLILWTKLTASEAL